MKDEEKTPSQVGLYNLPKGVSDAGSKVMQVFTKLKRKAEQSEAMPQSESGQITPLREIQPSYDEMQYRAMNSYRLQGEVLKTESRFEVG